MKVSEVTEQHIKNYARIDYNDDDTLIEAILTASKSYIATYTGLSDEELDTHEDITIALKVLCVEMLENRQYTVQNDKVNKVVTSILDIHSVNYL
jgi:uncharacterized phage protein (predicted DNA packaging)